jgi:hypothetical protein
VCTDESDYLKLYLKPEYKQIKEILIKNKNFLIYTGPDVSSLKQGEINPLHLIINAIGSDSFTQIELRGNYGKNTVGLAMGILYKVYNDWYKALHHMVFDVEGFNEIVQSYQNEGKKCRAIAWEGMKEYLSHVSNEDTKIFLKKLNDGSIQKDVNILITFPTDINYSYIT